MKPDSAIAIIKELRRQGHEAYLVGPVPSLELVALGQEDAQGEIGQETEYQARPRNGNRQDRRCQPHHPLLADDDPMDVVLDAAQEVGGAARYEGGFT